MAEEDPAFMIRKMGGTQASQVPRQVALILRACGHRNGPQEDVTFAAHEELFHKCSEDMPFLLFVDDTFLTSCFMPNLLACSHCTNL